jgi:hypothetical protein
LWRDEEHRINSGVSAHQLESDPPPVHPRETFRLQLDPPEIAFPSLRDTASAIGAYEVLSPTLDTDSEAFSSTTRAGVRAGVESRCVNDLDCAIPLVAIGTVNARAVRAELPALEWDS